MFRFKKGSKETIGSTISDTNEVTTLVNELAILDFVRRVSHREHSLYFKGESNFLTSNRGRPRGRCRELRS